MRVAIVSKYGYLLADPAVVSAYMALGILKNFSMYVATTKYGHITAI